MKKIVSLVLSFIVAGCGPGFHVRGPDVPPVPPIKPTLLYMYPIATAIVSVNATGNVTMLKKKPTTHIVSLLIPSAHAQVQANGVISVIYNRPGATLFTLDTSSFMNSPTYPQVSGDDLNMGSISISQLDDNSLKVCSEAPNGGKCNRLYIRVFTLGSNVANTITGTPGFINVDASTPYGIDVLAGSVTTPIGFNSSPMATSVIDAANVFTYTIPSNMNRMRLTNTGAISFPVKADLSNAGAGNYEMRLVVQYALGYVP